MPNIVSTALCQPDRGPRSTVPAPVTTVVARSFFGFLTSTLFSMKELQTTVSRCRVNLFKGRHSHPEWPISRFDRDRTLHEALQEPAATGRPMVNSLTCLFTHLTRENRVQGAARWEGLRRAHADSPRLSSDQTLCLLRHGTRSSGGLKGFVRH